MTAYDPKEHFSKEQIEVIEDIFTSKLNAMVVKVVLGNILVLVGGILYISNLGADIDYNKEEVNRNTAAIALLQQSDTNNRVVLSSIQADIAAIKASLIRLEALNR